MSKCVTLKEAFDCLKWEVLIVFMYVFQRTLKVIYFATVRIYLHYFNDLFLV